MYIYFLKVVTHIKLKNLLLIVIIPVIPIIIIGSIYRSKVYFRIDGIERCDNNGK